MKIAILTPSRQRSKNLLEFSLSVVETWSKETEIDFFIGIDNDDPQESDYDQNMGYLQKSTPSNFHVQIYQDQLPSIGYMWNALARLRPLFRSADIFIMGNDDLRYRTPNWDKIIVDKVSKWEHPFQVGWGNDLINGERHCAFPIVTKQWVQALGYFSPQHFKFFYHDTWLFDIAKRCNVTDYIPEVIMEHLHFSKYPKEADETTARARRNNTIQVDKQIWDETEKERIASADFLKKVIESYLSKKVKAKSINKP